MDYSFLNKNTFVISLIARFKINGGYQRISYSPCYDDGSFDANIVNQEDKYKVINTNSTRGFNVVRSTMPTSTDET